MQTNSSHVSPLAATVGRHGSRFTYKAAGLMQPTKKIMRCDVNLARLGSKAIMASRSAFSLVELLVVISIMAILSSLVVGSFSAIAGNTFEQAVSDFSETMEQARSYAMANNTYVYVGIEEVDITSTASAPPPGNGLVVVAIAASKDGTDGFGGTANWGGSANLVPISKLKLFRNLHLATAQLTYAGNMSRPVNNPSYFIGSATCVATTTFSWPIGASTPSYNFTKVIRFGPQGDANILQAAATPTVDWIEVGLQPIHGNAIASVSVNNISAIQIDGMTGTVRAYRP